MTNRTLKFYGQGFGTNPVTITAIIDGNTVYDGPVSTIDEILTSDPYPQDLCSSLFSTQIPVEFSGSFPVTIQVNSGFGIKLVTILENYILIPNPIYTPEQFEIVTNPDSGTEEVLDIFIDLASPAFSPEEIAVLSNPDTPEYEFRLLLTQHNVSVYVSGGEDHYNTSFSSAGDWADPKLDGAPILPPDPVPGGWGNWTWTVPVGSVLQFVCNIEAGQE